MVRLIVAEADRALRDGMGTDGLLDPGVHLLDPACGTGTFLIAAAGAVAVAAEARYGSGSVPAEVTAFAQRMNGLELLVGPYTVAHYRMLREVAGHGGTAARLPIYLADTLAPPAGAAGVATHLAFMGAPMVAERRAADAVKQSAPILAIIGNPPYRRLRKGEVERFVGADMARRWEDLKRPVQDAGFGRALNAFPDLYVAFYRWALWRLFDVEGAQGRGVIAFITNRGFLTGRGFGGLRRMLRRRFDVIRVLDLRGDSQGARPATVAVDENVFNIQVGVCILVAHATGRKPAGAEAEVRYADAWEAQAFTRAEKLRLAVDAADNPALLRERVVPGQDMDRLKPPGFADTDWPGVNELLRFRSNGIVTYRDDFAYATTQVGVAERVQRLLLLPLEQAVAEFRETRDRKAGPALKMPFNAAVIERVSYVLSTCVSFTTSESMWISRNPHCRLHGDQKTLPYSPCRTGQGWDQPCGATASSRTSTPSTTGAAGYSLSATTAAKGQAITSRLLWWAASPPPTGRPSPHWTPLTPSSPCSRPPRMQPASPSTWRTISRMCPSRPTARRSPRRPGSARASVRCKASPRRLARVSARPAWQAVPPVPS